MEEAAPPPVDTAAVFESAHADEAAWEARDRTLLAADADTVAVTFAASRILCTVRAVTRLLTGSPHLAVTLSLDVWRWAKAQECNLVFFHSCRVQDALAVRLDALLMDEADAVSHSVRRRETEECVAAVSVLGALSRAMTPLMALLVDRPEVSATGESAERDMLMQLLPRVEWRWRSLRW